MTVAPLPDLFAPRLVWRRWPRGGGQFATAAGCGQIYSLNRLPVEARTGGGSYVLTDFHWRNGRTAIVASATAGKALAEQWFADGPPRDGFARLRAAWGSWHPGVPDGQVGAAVMLPDGTSAHHLIARETYTAAMADDERRIPLDDLGGHFDESATTKRAC